MTLGLFHRHGLPAFAFKVSGRDGDTWVSYVFLDDPGVTWMAPVSWL